MIQVVRRSIVDVYNRYSFNRQSLAYDSKGRLYHLHNARFEQGKFGKAIMVEEGTTNIGSPASLFVRDSSWKLATGTSTVIDAYTRKYTFEPNLSGAFAYKTFTLTTGVAYTWSAEIKGEGSTVGKQVRLQSAAGSAYGTPVTLTTEWQRVTLTFTATNTSRVVGFIGVPDNTFVPGDVVYVRFFQLKNKPYATTFIDGTRAAETLTIPTAGVLNPQEGTVECWVKPLFNNTTNYQVIFLCALNGDRSAGTSKFTVWKDSANNVRFQLKDDNSAGIDVTVPNFLTNEVWTHLAVVYSTGLLKVFKNGSLVGQYTASMNPLNITSQHIICVGNSISNSSTDAFNSLIDDLRISNIARSDEEILTAYQSNQPLPVDGGTTLKLNFDGPDAQRAAKVLVV